MSGVMCHISCVRCQVSGIKCQVPGFMCQIFFLFFFYKLVGLVGGGSVINGAYPVYFINRPGVAGVVLQTPPLLRYGFQKKNIYKKANRQFTLGGWGFRQIGSRFTFLI